MSQNTPPSGASFVNAAHLPSAARPTASRRSQPNPERSPLSALIAKGRSGALSQPDFARAFATTRILLLSATEPEGDVVEPLLLTLPSGEPAVAVFASPEEVANDYLDAGPVPLPMTGEDLLNMLPPDVGLALNPGREHSLVLEPSHVPAFAFVALNPPAAPAQGAAPGSPSA